MSVWTAPITAAAARPDDHGQAGPRRPTSASPRSSIRALDGRRARRGRPLRRQRTADAAARPSSSGATRRRPRRASSPSASTSTPGSATRSPAARATRCGPTCRPRTTWTSSSKSSAVAAGSDAERRRSHGRRTALADGHRGVPARQRGSATAPSAPDGRGRRRRQRQRHGELDRAGQPAAARSPATRSRPTSARPRSPPTTVTGAPPATTTPISGLTNGTAYTFTVSAPTRSAAGRPRRRPTRSRPVRQPGGPVALAADLADHGRCARSPHCTTANSCSGTVGSSRSRPSCGTRLADQFPRRSTHRAACSATAAPTCRTAASSSPAATAVSPRARSASSTPTSSTRPPTLDAGGQHALRHAGTRRSPSSPTAATSPSAATPPTRSTWAETPEVYDPAANTWTAAIDVNTPRSTRRSTPSATCVPNGKVFAIGPEEDDSSPARRQQQDVDVGRRRQRRVQRLVGHVPAGQNPLHAAARTINTRSTARATKAVIDLTAATPTWRRTAPMNHRPDYHTLTMLADGRCSPSAVRTTSDQDSDHDRRAARPRSGTRRTETWTTVASMAPPATITRPPC